MTPHPEIENVTVNEFLRRYWVIIISIVGFIIGWAQINLRVEYQETRLTKLEQSQTLTNSDLAELKNGVVELKTILNERLPAPKK